jgi:hypothetical protein
MLSNCAKNKNSKDETFGIRKSKPRIKKKDNQRAILNFEKF